MSFFSIIIPLYNKEKFIEATLKSVFSQTFVDFEVIIVNDGSTDNSEQKVLQYTDSRIRYYLKENGGVSTARNFGISLANSNYITFLDADDYWYPDFLQVMFTNIQSFSAEQVFSAAIEIESLKQVYNAKYSVQQTKETEIVDYFDASRQETIICTSCAVFKKTVFDKIGVFDESIRSGEDTDLWIRIGLAYKVVFCKTILARYVFDSESLSRNKKYSTVKMNFSKFKNEELKHAGLKRFLDLNRFSLAIKSKINRDEQSFQKFYDAIDKHNLGYKKRLLLLIPSFILQKMVRFQYKMTDWGLVSSPFK